MGPRVVGWGPLRPPCDLVLLVAVNGAGLKTISDACQEPAAVYALTVRRSHPSRVRSGRNVLQSWMLARCG